MQGDRWRKVVGAVSCSTKPERGLSARKKLGSQNSIDKALNKYVEHLEADQEIW